MKTKSIKDIFKSAESSFKVRLLTFLAIIITLVLVFSFIFSIIDEFATIERSLVIGRNELMLEEEAHFQKYAHNIEQILVAMYENDCPQTSDDIYKLIETFTKQYSVNISNLSLADDSTIILDINPSKIGTPVPHFDRSDELDTNSFFDEPNKTYISILKINIGQLILTIEGDEFDALMKRSAVSLIEKKYWFSSSFTFIYDDDDNIVLDTYSPTTHHNSQKLLAQLKTISDEQGHFISTENDTYFICQSNSGNYNYCCGMNIAYAFNDVLSIYRKLFFTYILLSITLYVFISRIIRKTMILPLFKVNTSLSVISEGNLDETVESRDFTEFSILSNNINSTVNKLKEYIDEANTRNAQDLENARLVQLAALPSISKLINSQQTFDLYASMFTAKEVGGDFYDFYLINNSLYFLIADVSGKGIPAAMFMMNAKAVIKNLIESGKSLDEVCFEANNILISDSKASFFVTAWLGKLNLETGELNFVNAGHNAPLIKKANGSYEYLDNYKPNLVLSGLKNHKFNINTIQCDLGDELYLYTDGVTEAINANDELFGTNRLKELLNSLPENTTSIDICSAVKDDLDKFIGKIAQFDDITMLSIRFFGTNRYNFATIANIDLTSDVINFIQEKLTNAGFSKNFVLSLTLVSDEIFSNICNYAYAPDSISKDVNVSLNIDYRNQTVKVDFSDFGTPFNPIRVSTPDSLTKAPLERQIGGLGIHLIKQHVDEIYYEYKNDMNILTITKKDDSK